MPTIIGTSGKTSDDGPQTTPALSLDDLGFNDSALTLPSDPEAATLKADPFDDAFVLPTVTENTPLVLPDDGLDSAHNDGPLLTLDPDIRTGIVSHFGPLLIEDLGNQISWTDHRYNNHFGG